MELGKVALSDKQVDAAVLESIRAGGVIPDEAARIIASWHSSTQLDDAQLTNLAEGRSFNPDRLAARVDKLIVGVFGKTDVLPELLALFEWAMSKTRHVLLQEVNATQEELDTWRESIPDDRVQFTRLRIEAFADDLGGWVAPGEERYPADLAGYNIAPLSGFVWMPGSEVDTAAALLLGKSGEFWAQEYDRPSPFEPGGTYSSRYMHPHHGTVELKTGRLVGFTAAEEHAIHEAWLKA